MIKILRKIKSSIFGIKSKLYSSLFKKMIVSHRGRISVNALSIVSQEAKVYVDDNFCTNGIKISGKGLVKIGRNFHSGTNYLI